MKQNEKKMEYYRKKYYHYKKLVAQESQYASETRDITDIEKQERDDFIWESELWEFLFCRKPKFVEKRVAYAHFLRKKWYTLTRIWLLLEKNHSTISIMINKYDENWKKY